jgi:hypothetical protein
MVSAELSPTVSASKGENNIIAAVLTLRRLLQHPFGLIKNWLMRDGLNV